MCRLSFRSPRPVAYPTLRETDTSAFVFLRESTIPKRRDIMCGSQFPILVLEKETTLRSLITE